MDAATTPDRTSAAPALWQQLADTIPQLAWIADPTGDIFWYNRRWYDYTGTTLESMRGWGWQEVQHPDRVADVVEHWTRALATGEPFEETFPLRGADGVFRQFLTRAQPLRDGDGKITHWFGTNTDVTDQVANRRRGDYILALEALLREGGDAETVKQRVTELIARELGASRAAYIETDVASHAFVISQQYLAPGVRSIPGRYEGPTFVALFERFMDGQTLVVADTSADDRVASLRDDGTFEKVEVRALIDTPIFRAGQLLSLLSVHQVDPRAWTEDEVDLVRLTAERTADAVARYRVETDLRRSEARLARATRAAGMFAWETDHATGKVTWGEGAAEMLGVARHELPSNDDFFVDPAERSRLRQEYRQALAERRTSVSLDFRGIDGREWCAEVGVDYDEHGRPQTAYGVTRDVTQKNVRRRALEASEAQFRSVADALPGVLFVTDDQGRNIYINRGYRVFAGLGHDEMLGDDWPDIVHPDDLSLVLDETERSRSAGTMLKAEYRLRRHDGEYRWHLTQAAPVMDGDGAIVRWVGVSIDIDDRRAAQQAMTLSEARYRALFETMEQGFCVIKLTFDGGKATDYCFQELNPAFTRHSGLGQEVLHQSVQDVIPGLEDVWFERYASVALTGKPIRIVDRVEALGRWLEIYAFPIGTPDERLVAVLFTDISDRIAQEEALRRSEQDMRMRLNAIPQMVWSTLPDGFHDFYNDRWYEFTGTPLGSTDGEGWNGMFHPDDQAVAWERWRRSLASGEPYEIEYRLRHHTGTYRWVLGRALPIRDEAGAIVRWMGTCTDIDDRIAVEGALRDSEARLRAVIGAMPVGLVFADPTGRLTGGNDMIRELLGGDIPLSDAVADYKRDYAAFHADGRRVESDEYPLARVLSGEADRAELECRVERMDGKRKWIRYVAAPIRDGRGERVGGVVASIDIDREKRLTEELHREVEQVVAEREAAQEALRQSQKLESMGQLTGGVAHDFNNLLTPIIGSLDLLQRKQILDERTGRLVGGALASAEKARVLVQRLLAFARRQPLQPQPIDVAGIVLEMSELIASTSGPRVRVLTEVADEIPPALADGNQLEMALLNLSVNARDAMPDGGTLTIAVRADAARADRRLGLREGAHVVLSVSDTGLGMDEDTRRRAIEPFFSTKGIGKGTGLGLSMVHGLAAQLGGALDIRSAPGMGTTIELWLPVAQGRVADGPAEPVEADGHAAGTALLVDDEELVRASTGGMLADLGYRVVEADSGEAALALVADGLRPDLLVTDQLMPGLSGTDLAMRLREKFPDLPVLIVSGYADIDSLSPAFPHLSKPFRQDELSSALDKVAAPD